MNKFLACFAFTVGAIVAAPANADPLYNNLQPTDAIAMASRIDGPAFEIETADDFVLATHSTVQSASFVGLIGANSSLASIAQVRVEIYRVFPLDSDTGRTSGPPIFSTSQVPTRVNSPSDVAFAERDSGASSLTFSANVLSGSFTTINSIQPGGIHPTPGQTTGGNGPVNGQEVQFDVTFTTPFDLPADHYFFVPQVLMSDGTTFYWLSASRPIIGPGTTPFLPDLQAWTRDEMLDPDWLRVGTDIVGAGTFNAAFSLDGQVVPEPSTIALMGLALAALGVRRRSSSRTRLSS